MYISVFYFCDSNKCTSVSRLFKSLETLMKFVILQASEKVIHD